MPIRTNCPSCRGAVRVPEELLGRRVQCPKCQTTFIAEADDQPEPRPADEPTAGRDSDDPRPRRRTPQDDDEGDYDDRPRRRGYGRPHRGGVVLALGILGIVMSCLPFGIFAWVMGNNDLDAMRKGDMDREGEGITQAGKICGIVGTCLFAISCILWAFYGVILVALVGGGMR